ncbi:MAG: hypothetical protein IT381_06375 [Deltaproteobacteria bacterium]|nr:hypothetical protein [Deltaproteobacteria bacterium]
MNARHVHRIATEIRRTINGNLDGALDSGQAREIMAQALERHVPIGDILEAFHRAAGDKIDGEPVTRLIDEALNRKPGRRDN